MLILLEDAAKVKGEEAVLRFAGRISCEMVYRRLKDGPSGCF
jgi:formate dehydrogenase assembly factor FdhD